MTNIFESQPWYVNIGIGAGAAFALSMLMAKRSASPAKTKGDAIAQFGYQMGIGEGYNTENDHLETQGYPDDTAVGESQGEYADDGMGVGDGMYDVLIPAY